MSDTPDEPPTGELLGQPGRPRWLAAAAVLLVSVTIGSVVALRNGNDTGDVAAGTSSLPPSTAATSVPSGATEPEPTTESTAPLTSEQVPTSPTTQDTAAEATTDDSSTVDDSTPATYGAVEPGQGIATMKIPRLDLTAFVLAGSSPAQMATAVGHLSTTSAPGQLGNAVVVGYRTTQPALFKDLDQLAVGDVIEVDTVIGGVYYYQVDGSVVVEPTNASVVTASVPGKATLTLITCAPKGSTLQRLVVHAALVEALSSPADPAQTNYGQSGSAPEPSVEPCNMTPA